MLIISLKYCVVTAFKALRQHLMPFKRWHICPAYWSHSRRVASRIQGLVYGSLTCPAWCPVARVHAGLAVQLAPPPLWPPSSTDGPKTANDSWDGSTNCPGYQDRMSHARVRSAGSGPSISLELNFAVVTERPTGHGMPS